MSGDLWTHISRSVSDGFKWIISLTPNQLWEGLRFSIDEKTALIVITAIISALGSVFLVKCFDAICVSLRSIFEEIKEVVRWEWVPAKEIRESLKETRKQLAKSGPKIRNAYKASVILVISIILGATAWSLVYRQFKELTQWQGDITDRLIRIEEQHNMQETSTGGDTSIVYSLAYVNNGNLDNMCGICPDGVNLEWLKVFKLAIEECSTETSRVDVNIKGFASIAPADVPGITIPSDSYAWDIPYTDWYNLQVANQRGRAVMEILTSEEDIGFDTCVSILNGDRKTQRYNRQTKFDIKWVRWNKFGEMMAGRPVYDGSQAGVRLRQAEFMNRAVEITVRNVSCWRREWLGVEH